MPTITKTADLTRRRPRHPDPDAAEAEALRQVAADLREAHGEVARLTEERRLLMKGMMTRRVRPSAVARIAGLSPQAVSYATGRIKRSPRRKAAASSFMR